MRATRSVGVLWPALAALAITLQACSGTGPLNEEPDLTGLVASVESDGGVVALSNVVYSGGVAGGDQAIIRTTDATVVQYVTGSGTWSNGSPRDIRAGASIRVWTDGVELRSNPPQYYAVRIEMSSARGP